MGATQPPTNERLNLETGIMDLEIPFDTGRVLRAVFKITRMKRHFIGIKIR